MTNVEVHGFIIQLSQAKVEVYMFIGLYVYFVGKVDKKDYAKV